MSKVVDSPEATPGSGQEPADFRSYKQQISLRDEPSSETAVGETPEETAPESAPGAKSETSKSAAKPARKELTPEERSARDRARDDRKWSKLTSELADTRKQLAELKAGKAESAPAPSTAKPRWADYVKDIGEGRKYESWDDAREAYDGDHAAWLREDIRAEFERERETARTQNEAQQVFKGFKAKLKAYADSNPDFAETQEVVTEAIEDALGARNHVSDSIVRCDHPAEVFQYLHDHPATLDRVLDMTSARARMEIGAISAKFDTSEAAEESPKPKTDEAARSQRTVRGRGDVPSHLAGMNKAAEAGNYRDFRAQKRAAQQSKAKY